MQQAFFQKIRFSRFSSLSFGAFFKSFCSIVFLALFFIACGGGSSGDKKEEKTAGNFIIVGNLKDSSSGDSVSGATVFLDGDTTKSVLSSTAGTFRFEVELTPGTHMVAATKGNYV